MLSKEETTSCSFCGKDSKEVNKLIKGAYVYICDECVHLCQEILDNGKKDSNTTKRSNSKIPSAIELKSYVDEYIVGQHKAKKILTVSIVNHYKRVNNPIIDGIELEKENVMVIGPSGTGKTAIVKTISKKLRIPFVICDSTVLSEVGYVGADPDSLIKRLVKAAGNNPQEAEKGIIFIDEIDKKAKRNLSSGSKDASGEGVQQALLKIIEGTIVDVEIPGKGGKSETVKIDTSNILFIVAGAFSGIDKIIDKRMNKNKIGFNSANNEQDVTNKILLSDIIEYGIIPELMGRIPIIAQLETLTKQEIKDVLLNTKNSIIKQYHKIFLLDGINLKFTDDAIDYIVEESFLLSTGVRGIRNIIEDKLLDIQYNIEVLKKDLVETIIVDENFFKNEDVEPIYKKQKITIDDSNNIG